MEWISVEDRLPEEEKTVLCKQIYHNELMLCYIQERFWKEDYQELEAYGNSFIVNEVTKVTGGCEYLKITHWMPLPEPPKENNDDN